MNELQMFGSLECSQALAPVLSHVFSDIQHLALVKSKENIHSTSQSLSALKDDLKLPLLPDLIRRLAEERMELERDIHKDSDVNDQDGLTEICSGTPSSNVILKVPSFKPAKSPTVSIEGDDPCLPVLSSSSSPPPGTSSHVVSGNKGIAVSLKELIARSISQKVSCHLKDKAFNEEHTVEYSYATSNVDSPACSIPWVVDGASKDLKEGTLSNINNSSNSSDSSKSEKRTRPKRGRYRNYDRDNLARAVRAVQKGEMSVHRAGTFYGVPHSTLEYKVKERHLLRPRKRDLLNNSLVADAVEPVSASKANHTFSIESHTSVKNVKTNSNQIAAEASNGLPTDIEQPHRPTMGSYPSPLSLWQSMPFLSLDFSHLSSNNFFASQMMRKLQENARLHEETQKKRK
ncbi:Mushroom body large-type Kenyon cell-specific protein 1, partial [Stegodyphus mimosarum]